MEAQKIAMETQKIATEQKLAFQKIEMEMKRHRDNRTLGLDQRKIKNTTKN